jgi:hypothetical protein
MKEIDIQKEKAKQIKAMMVTDGWKIIEQCLVDKSKELTNKLLEAKDILEVQRLQAEIKALQTFFDKIMFYSQISI